MNTPMGAQNGTMDLTTDGGALTGTMKSPQGDIELKEGTVDGDALTWKADITSPMAMTLEFPYAPKGKVMDGASCVKYGKAVVRAWNQATFLGN